MGGDCEVFSTSILETSFNGYKWLICLGCLMCLIQATHLLDKTVPMLFLPPFPSPSLLSDSRDVLMQDISLW